MTWDTAKLLCEITEDFADPRWHGLPLRDASSSVLNKNGVKSAPTLRPRKPSKLWSIVSFTSDADAYARIAELADERYVWTAPELSEALDVPHTHSQEVLYGLVFSGENSGWRYLKGQRGAGARGVGHSRWLNGAKLQALLESRTDVRMRDVQSEIGVHYVALTSWALDTPGWTRSRKAGAYVWNYQRL